MLQASDLVLNFSIKRRLNEPVPARIRCIENRADRLRTVFRRIRARLRFIVGAYRRASIKRQVASTREMSSCRRQISNRLPRAESVNLCRPCHTRSLWRIQSGGGGGNPPLTWFKIFCNTRSLAAAAPTLSTTANFAAVKRGNYATTGQRYCAINHLRVRSHGNSGCIW